MENYKFIATTTFGLESTVKRELSYLDVNDIKTQDGRIDFCGDFYSMMKANINLRSADRILWCVAEGNVTSFEDLFQLVSSFDWGKYLPENANFHINGKSVKSKLSSVPACQKIVEKAVVKKMQERYNVDFFEKSGALYKVQVSILKDVATITIDTSGDSLHKRGYRENQLSAPLKETLAHALIELSYWKKDRILLDPCCGSGTIPIEAALMAKNIAPGVNRKFVSEYWGFLDKSLWDKARQEARAKENRDFIPEIYGYDIDDKAIEIAIENAKKAGVEDCITFKVQSVSDLKIDKEYGIVITNPPYGERIGEEKEVLNLYRTFGDKFRNEATWSFYCITSNEDFERLYGKRSDKKRKLYNGKIKIDYYQYNGSRPPRKDV